MSALVVVDVQNDFCRGGSLAVDGGLQVAKDISEFIKKRGGTFELVIGTQDWHDPVTSNGGHFDEWPRHCLANTWGAEFAQPLHEGYFDTIIQKGQGQPAYSAFDGKNMFGYNLDEILYNEGIEDIWVVGLAFDYCVKATALDGIKHGYSVLIPTDLTAAVEDWDNAAEELLSAGVVLK